MQITGQILKKNREQAKLSLVDVATSTKINIKILEAIEEGQLESLPPITFLRGFVRTYARFLKLDESQIIQGFEEEMNTPKPQFLAVETEEKLSDNPDQIIKSDSKTKKYLTVAAIMILIVAIGLVKKTVEKYEREKELPTSEDIQEIVKVQPLENSINPPSSETPTVQELETTGDTKAAETSPSETPPVGTPVNTDTVEIGTANQEKKDPSSPTEKPTMNTNTSPTKVDKLAEKLPEKPAVKVAEIIPEPTKVDKIELDKKEDLTTAQDDDNDSSQELIIEALDNIKIEISLDNQKTKVISLKASEVFVAKANQAITVEFSDGGAVSIIHNGQNKGVPGDLGKSLKMNLN
jgi:cytoskeleton protein RodZ